MCKHWPDSEIIEVFAFASLLNSVLWISEILKFAILLFCSSLSVHTTASQHSHQLTEIMQTITRSAITPQQHIQLCSRNQGFAHPRLDPIKTRIIRTRTPTLSVNLLLRLAIWIDLILITSCPRTCFDWCCILTSAANSKMTQERFWFLLLNSWNC